MKNTLRLNHRWQKILNFPCPDPLVLVCFAACVLHTPFHNSWLVRFPVSICMASTIHRGCIIYFLQP